MANEIQIFYKKIWHTDADAKAKITFDVKHVFDDKLIGTNIEVHGMALASRILSSVRYQAKKIYNEYQARQELLNKLEGSSEFIDAG